MKISDLSPEQTAILDRANQESNRGGIVPPLDEFVVSLLNDQIETFRKQQVGKDFSIVSDKLEAAVKNATLDASDIAQIVAIVDAKNPPKEVAPATPVILQ